MNGLGSLCALMESGHRRPQRWQGPCLKCYYHIKQIVQRNKNKSTIKREKKAQESDFDFDVFASAHDTIVIWHYCNMALFVSQCVEHVISM